MTETQTRTLGNPMAVSSLVVGLIALGMRLTGLGENLAIIGAGVAIVLAITGYTRAKQVHRGTALSVFGGVAGVLALIPFGLQTALT